MATWDESLNTRHISSNLSNYEMGRSGFFTLIVSDLDNLLKINYKGEYEERTEDDVIKHAQEYLKLNVVSTSVPGFSVNPLTYRRGNDVVKFAGIPEFKDGSIKVDDVVGLDTKSILYAWLYLAYNPHTRKGGRGSDYKKTCTLCEYTQDYKLVRTWTLEGCFVTSIEESEFDKENDGKRQLTASISYDRAIQELPEEEVI